MKIQSAKLVYFSPTGTTKSVVRGTDPGSVDELDITRPAVRELPLKVSENDLLILGVLVYMGRVPGTLMEWLHAIHARNTPAVPVVVYGNRAYDDSLLELSDILAQSGRRPVAGGAWIGEHSFTRDETLHPYRRDSPFWNVDFIAISDACTQCGTCAEGCPVGAIDPENSTEINTEKCITRCACIRTCSRHAKTIKPVMVMDASVRRHALYSERKEPEYFVYGGKRENYGDC